jgi:hypothetical protein
MTLLYHIRQRGPGVLPQYLNRYARGLSRFWPMTQPVNNSQNMTSGYFGYQKMIA